MVLVSTFSLSCRLTLKKGPICFGLLAVDENVKTWQRASVEIKQKRLGVG